MLIQIILLIVGFVVLIKGADFFVDGSWNYAAMIEYFVAAMIACIVVGSIFRILGKWVSR